MNGDDCFLVDCWKLKIVERRPRHHVLFDLKIQLNELIDKGFMGCIFVADSVALVLTTSSVISILIPFNAVVRMSWSISVGRSQVIGISLSHEAVGLHRTYVWLDLMKWRLVELITPKVVVTSDLMSRLDITCSTTDQVLFVHRFYQVWIKSCVHV